MPINQPSPSTPVREQAIPPQEQGSVADDPQVGEGLTRLLDHVAARIGAGWAEIDRRRSASGRHVGFWRRANARSTAEIHAPTLLVASALAVVRAVAIHRRARPTVPSRRHIPRRSPAPGSDRPCTRTGCHGTMTYGGDSAGHAQTAEVREAEHLANHLRHAAGRLTMITRHL